jgi:hypothetical protein
MEINAAGSDPTVKERIAVLADNDAACAAAFRSWAQVVPWLRPPRFVYKGQDYGAKIESEREMVHAFNAQLRQSEPNSPGDQQQQVSALGAVQTVELSG